MFGSSIPILERLWVLAKRAKYVAGNFDYLRDLFTSYLLGCSHVLSSFLVFSGPNVMKGYHNNLAATNEVITLAPDGKSKL